MYKKFLSTNCKGCYYAIVDAGENGAPILIVTNAPENIVGYIYNGYPIVAYTFIDGQVYPIDNGNQITQSTSSGPWYIYENKLYTLARRGGYFRVDFHGSSYERPFFNSDDYSIFTDKNIVKLSYSA